jgi:hypothetical protein
MQDSSSRRGILDSHSVKGPSAGLIQARVVLGLHADPRGVGKEEHEV